MVAVINPYNALPIYGLQSDQQRFCCGCKCWGIPSTGNALIPFQLFIAGPFPFAAVQVININDESESYTVPVQIEQLEDLSGFFVTYNGETLPNPLENGFWELRITAQAQVSEVWSEVIHVCNEITTPAPGCEEWLEFAFYHKCDTSGVLYHNGYTQKMYLKVTFDTPVNVIDSSTKVDGFGDTVIKNSRLTQMQVLETLNLTDGQLSAFYHMMAVSNVTVKRINTEQIFEVSELNFTSSLMADKCMNRGRMTFICGKEVVTQCCNESITISGEELVIDGCDYSATIMNVPFNQITYLDGNGILQNLLSGSMYYLYSTIDQLEEDIIAAFIALGVPPPLFDNIPDGVNVAYNILSSQIKLFGIVTDAGVVQFTETNCQDSTPCDNDLGLTISVNGSGCLIAEGTGDSDSPPTSDTLEYRVDNGPWTAYNALSPPCDCEIQNMLTFTVDCETNISGLRFVIDVDESCLLSDPGGNPIADYYKFTYGAGLPDEATGNVETIETPFYTNAEWDAKSNEVTFLLSQTSPKGTITTESVLFTVPTPVSCLTKTPATPATYSNAVLCDIDVRRTVTFEDCPTIYIIESL